jgi:flagellar protein FlgJ
MAISPLSDIVVDVLQAADPAKQRAASDKLNYMREVANADFDLRLDEMSTKRARATAPVGRPDLPDSARILEATTAPVLSGGRIPNDSAVPAVYRKFEAVVLQSFIEAMLPQQAEKVFGKGTAGSIWRSMLAEQLGNQLAKSGGVGIAKSLAIARPVVAAAASTPVQLGAASQPATGTLATDILATDLLATKKGV